MELINKNNEKQTITNLDSKEQENKNISQESKNGKKQTLNTSTANINKENTLEISYDEFNLFLRDFFNDMTNDTFEEIISYPEVSRESIHSNLYKSKCVYLTKNDINVEDLLVSALMGEQSEEEEISSNNYDDDILLKSIKENETVIDEFFETYKGFCDEIDLNNINIREEDKIVELLKKQIRVNNVRRERLKEVLEKKLETLAILRLLREIDKRIEKIAFKRIKTKRKKKPDENFQQLFELIQERNQFYDAFKNEIDSASEVLNISKNIFEDENVDVSSFGFAKRNIFPD